MLSNKNIITAFYNKINCAQTLHIVSYTPIQNRNINQTKLAVPKNVSSVAFSKKE